MNRSSQTKQHIFNAFCRLLYQVPFEKITVEMIIQESNVSKSTFYRHFHDKYEVLNFNALAICERLIGEADCRSWEDFFQNMFQVISQDFRFYRRAFRSSGQNSHSGFLYAYSFSIVEKSYLTTTGQTALSAIDHYAISHYCHGCVGILQEWLQAPDTFTPKEMAHLFYTFMPDYLKNTWDSNVSQ